MKIVRLFKNYWSRLIMENKHFKLFYLHKWYMVFNCKLIKSQGKCFAMYYAFLMSILYYFAVSPDYFSIVRERYLIMDNHSNLFFAKIIKNHSIGTLWNHYIGSEKSFFQIHIFGSLKKIQGGLPLTVSGTIINTMVSELNYITNEGN